MEKLLHTPEEAAEILSVGRTTVYELMKLEALASVKIGKTRRIPAAELLDFVERLMNSERD